jgi:signal transduction histidine kinase
LFQNLISNALKFNNSGHPYIKVEMNEISDEQATELRINQKEYISFSIQDNGIGFDPKYKEKIFGVFQRLHSSASYQGTGIGLAICKKIIENHNGFIFAESELNKGTRFTILLPVKQPLTA